MERLTALELFCVPTRGIDILTYPQKALATVKEMPFDKLVFCALFASSYIYFLKHNHIFLKSVLMYACMHACIYIPYRDMHACVCVLCIHVVKTLGGKNDTKSN